MSYETANDHFDADDFDEDEENDFDSYSDAEDSFRDYPDDYDIFSDYFTDCEGGDF